MKIKTLFTASGAVAILLCIGAIPIWIVGAIGHWNVNISEWFPPARAALATALLLWCAFVGVCAVEVWKEEKPE